RMRATSPKTSRGWRAVSRPAAVADPFRGDSRRRWPTDFDSKKDLIMSARKEGSPLVDEARQLLCREIARCLQDKKFSVRIRVADVDGEPAEAWFYSHTEQGWQMEPRRITDRPLVAALNETVEMLASKGHHDAWTARRHLHSDLHDTDLQFHVDKL